MEVGVWEIVGVAVEETVGPGVGEEVDLCVGGGVAATREQACTARISKGINGCL